MSLLTRSVEWIADKALNWLAKRAKSKEITDVSVIQDVYRKTLVDIRLEHDVRIKELMGRIDEKNQIIESYKGRQVNGREMNEWQDSNTEMGQQILKLMKEVMELKTQLMFCLKFKNK